MLTPYQLGQAETRHQPPDQPNGISSEMHLRYWRECVRSGLSTLDAPVNLFSHAPPAATCVDRQKLVGEIRHVNRK